MKYIIGIVLVVVMFGVFFYEKSDVVENINNESTVEVKTIEPTGVNFTDEDAIQAGKDVIRKKELEAELKGLKDVQASTTAKIKEVEKELGIF